MEIDLEKLKYQIGKFEEQEDYNLIEIERFISTIRTFPEDLAREIDGLVDGDLEKTYRPGGWTIKQVVHHVFDSHMNALLRFKLALTEENPIIKPYNEAAFANLLDYNLPLNTTMNAIFGVHQHWVQVIAGMKNEDFDRTYFHPEQQKAITLKTALAIYNWHCKHHLDHVKIAKKQMN
jgi:hypothetical protein